jgi:hypothetical protein
MQRIGGLMTHKEKTKYLYKDLEKKYPDIAQIMVEMFIDKMPTEAYISMIFFENEKDEICHLLTKEQYDVATELFEWVDDKGTGIKWSVDDIVKLSNISFETKDYTKFDYAYVVNMLWSDYCNVFIEPSYYLKMAKNYLEDPDYCGDASERAYHNAKNRIKYSIEEY